MFRRTRTLWAVTVMAVAGLPVALSSLEPVRHLALDRSVPEADAVVESATEVRLWFTEAPHEGSTSIRVIDGAGNLVPSTEAAASAEDVRAFFVTVDRPLVDGVYKVAWRALAADGHAASEEFTFTVRSSE